VGRALGKGAGSWRRCGSGGRWCERSSWFISSETFSALPEVTVLASGDEIVQVVAATLRPRHDVVNVQANVRGSAAAVPASETVSSERLKPTRRTESSPPLDRLRFISLCRSTLNNWIQPSSFEIR
jgi:hypothetical protein